MGTAAERKRQLTKLRAELAAALKIAPDRRARRLIEEEFKGKMEELTENKNKGDATSDNSHESAEPEGNVLKASGLSRQVRRAEMKQKKMASEYAEKLERHALTDRSAVEEEKLMEIIPDGLVMVDMPADGSCLYHAIIHQLVQNFDQHFTVRELRRVVADWIEQHKDEYAAYLPDTTVDEYCSNIRLTNQYGDEIEIKATSEALGLAINVHTANGTIKYQPNSGVGGDAKVVHLVFLQHKYGSRKSMVEWGAPICATIAKVCVFCVAHYNSVQRRS